MAYPQQQQSPWNELLPDGTSLADLIRKKLTSPTTPPPTQPGQQVRWLNPERSASVPQPEPATGAQTLLPAAPATDTTAAQPASTYDPASTAQRPAIVGGSLETDPLKRQAARIRTMIDNPTREVDASGTAGTSHPMSRKKAALLGLLNGLSQASQHDSRLAAVLAGGATGLAIGAVKPRAIQEMVRGQDVQESRNQLLNQTELAKQQSQVEDQQAQTRQRQMAPDIAIAEEKRKARVEADRLKIEQDNANRAERKLKQDAAEGQLNRTSREKIAGSKPKLMAGRTKLVDGQNIYVDENGDPVLGSDGQPIVHGEVKPVAGESQADSDKRDADYQATKAEAEVLHNEGDNIDKKLRVPSGGYSNLYEQRNQAQMQLDKMNKDLVGATEEGLGHKTQRLAAAKQVKTLSNQITKIEGDRDKRYEQAAIKHAEAGKYQRPPKSVTPRPGSAAPKKFTSLSDAIQGFKNSPKNTTHRDPTASEIETLKSTYGVQ